MNTLAVVEQILRETQVPMSVKQIVEQARGRLPTRSKTPDTVVARDLSMDIKRKGEASLFIRTEPGRYTLRELALSRDGQSANRPQNQSEQRLDGAKPTPLAATAIQVERAGPLAARSLAESDSSTQPTVRGA